MDLTKEKQDIGFAIVEGIKRRGVAVQTLGGFAGTGKSHLISFLHTIFPCYAVCAYTGKAADVLRRKGLPATTIHRLIYRPFAEPGGAVTFQLAESLGCEGVIVDEASMVTEEMDADLRSFGIPILYVGDHGQLPPIGKDFNLMAAPMYRLETIHRYAGTLAKFCQWVREGRKPQSFPIRDGKVCFLRPWDVTPRLLASGTEGVDQTICAFNRTRVELNAKARSFLGFTEKLHIGDRLMCLRNSRKSGLFNGMQGEVRDFWKEKRKFLVDFESGEDRYRVQYDPNQLGEEKTVTPYSKDGPLPFDYAYAKTAHKCQGDQFPIVLVIEQVCDARNHCRWCYSAASRVQEKLYWCW